MNKGSRSTLLVAVLCILVGIAIIAVAVALTPGGFSKIWKDAVNTNYMDKLENIGVSVPGGSKNWKNAYSPDGKYTVTESVSGIDIDWLAGKVIVKPYSGKDITFTETADKKITEDTALGWGIEKGVLSIQYLKRNNISLGSKDPIKTIEVLVPQQLADNMSILDVDSTSGIIDISEIKADKMDADAASGDVYLSNVTAKELDVDTASGNAFMTDVKVEGTLNIDSASGDAEISGYAGKADIDTASGGVRATDLTAGDLSIDTSSGDISVCGAFKKVEFETASGEIYAELTEFPEYIDIDGASGNVTLALPPSGGGFTLDYDSGSGDLDCGVPVMMKGSSFVYGDGSCSISVDTASGDLTLKFIV